MSRHSLSPLRYPINGPHHVLSGPRDALSSSCLDAARKWVGDQNLTSATEKSPFACPHGYARERVLEVYHKQLPPPVVKTEKLAAVPLLMLHAVVEHHFRIACTREGGPRADNDYNVSALNACSECARADAVGIV